MDNREQLTVGFPGFFESPEKQEANRDEFNRIMRNIYNPAYACHELNKLIEADGARLIENPSIQDLMNPSKRLFTAELMWHHLTPDRFYPMFLRWNYDGSCTSKGSFDSIDIFSKGMPASEAKLMVDLVGKVIDNGSVCGIYEVTDALEEKLRKYWTPRVYRLQVLRVLDSAAQMVTILFEHFNSFGAHSKNDMIVLDGMRKKLSASFVQVNSLVESIENDQDSLELDYPQLEKDARDYVDKLGKLIERLDEAMQIDESGKEMVKKVQMAVPFVPYLYPIDTSQEQYHSQFQ